MFMNTSIMGVGTVLYDPSRLGSRLTRYQCWILLLCYSCLLSVTCSSYGSNNEKSIFILAGQSNMAGRGGVINNVWDRNIPIQSSPDPSVLRLNAKLRWVEAKEPIHRDIDVKHTCGVSPAMALANSVIHTEPKVGVVGLVPCAVGGTNISQWARGGHLYSQLVRRAKAAVREGGTIQALFWYQGESDTVVKSDAGNYKQRLVKFFSDVRSDLDSPMLPIIQVALASGEGPYIEEIREAQMGVELLNLKTVDAKGLPLEPDNLHLTTPAQVQLGEKLAFAFLQFLPTQVESNPGNMLVQTNAGNFVLMYCLYSGFITFFVVFTLTGYPV